MNVTFITGHLCKERHALLHELALDLGTYGAKVTVLTGFPSRRISDEVRRYYLEHPVEQIGENVIVRRVGSRAGEGNGLLQRMIKYVFLTARLYREAKKTPTDVFYLYSSPPFLGVIGGLLTKKAPTVYNVQDLFPDTLIRVKGYGESNRLIRILRKMEAYVYRKNTKIVTISGEMKRTIISHGCSEEKIEAVYNWADTKKLSHVDRDKNVLMDELKIDKNKFIISYAGDLGLFQGWNTILKAADILKKDHSDIAFVLIGSGSYKDKMERLIREKNLYNVQLLPLQPADRLSEIYSIGDIELVSVEKGLTRLALPSKTWTIMAAGTPLLALVDQNSDIAEVVNAHKIGWTMELGSAPDLADRILAIQAESDQCMDYGINARNYVEKVCPRQKQTGRYFDILKSCIR